MKRSISIFLSLAFVALFAFSAFAQGVTKIGFVESNAFGDDKEGIRKFVNAQTAVDNEFKAKFTELDNMAKRMTTLSDEIAKMGQNPAVPVDQKAYLAKQNEGVKLQKDYNFKKDDYETAYKNRLEEMTRPISIDIGKAVQDFAKQKGYTAILDLSALVQAGAVLSLDPTANLTKEFIAYYNTRPATGTASTATPAKTP